jgi:uncharacterized membrane-anchored protein
MQSIHMPRVDGRYWLAIALASIFGTNLGDLYAHESGLGIVPGIAILAAIAAGVFLVERNSDRTSVLFYWLVIIIIRTGATNIADYLAFRVHIPMLPLSIGLAAILGAFAWQQHAANHGAVVPHGGDRLPSTGAVYWSAMLVAGVFGTVAGDYAQHNLGEDIASGGLALLLIAVFAVRGLKAGHVLSYWATLALARTTGTALGDWLAESPHVNLGLPVATAISGTAFVLVLTLLPKRAADQ